MPASEKQIKANRQNAQKSTGPKTDRGKQTAARNSLKHGLFAGDIIVVSPHYTEDPDEYRQLVEGLKEELAPTTLFQECLVRKIANCLWRSRRVISAETARINHQLSTVDDDVESEVDFRKYRKIKNAGTPEAVARIRQELVGINSIPSESWGFHIQRYEMRLDRQMTRAYHLLQQLQKTGRVAQEPCAPEAGVARPSHCSDPDISPLDKESIVPSPVDSVGPRSGTAATRFVQKRPDAQASRAPRRDCEREEPGWDEDAGRTGGLDPSFRWDDRESGGDTEGAVPVGTEQCSVRPQPNMSKPRQSGNTGVEAMFTGLSDIKSEWDIRHNSGETAHAGKGVNDKKRTKRTQFAATSGKSSRCGS